MKMKTISISLPQDLIYEIDRLARKLSVSRSEVIRNAIRAFLNTRKASRIKAGK